MYVARPLSAYIKNPDALSLPPDGPNSGFMVIQDEDFESFSCFGLFKNRTLQDLPFPQNKILTVRYELSTGEVGSTYYSLTDVLFIPVLNLPLSSNRYYAIKPNGNHKGEAFTCTREEETGTSCFCSGVKDIEQEPFDATNVYQQFEICVHEGLFVGMGHFYAKSVAPDRYPPFFMRRKGWSVDIKAPKSHKLEEAPGLDASLRARLPGLDIPLSYKTSEAVVVGKWYAPFMFVKEGKMGDQMKRSAFYIVTLEQKWEQMYASQNDHLGDNSVSFDVILDQEMVYVAGNKVVWDEKSHINENVIWFASAKAKVGLAVELVQRMKWEQERGGWIGGKERQVSVNRSDKFVGYGDWKGFGSYVLVESFVIKKMDGSLVLTYDFKHSQHIRSIWQ